MMWKNRIRRLMIIKFHELLGGDHPWWPLTVRSSSSLWCILVRYGPPKSPNRHQSVVYDLFVRNMVGWSMKSTLLHKLAPSRSHRANWWDNAVENFFSSLEKEFTIKRIYIIWGMTRRYYYKVLDGTVILVVWVQRPTSSPPREDRNGLPERGILNCPLFWTVHS